MARLLCNLITFFFLLRKANTNANNTTAIKMFLEFDASREQTLINRHKLKKEKKYYVVMFFFSCTNKCVAIEGKTNSNEIEKSTSNLQSFFIVQFFNFIFHRLSIAMNAFNWIGNQQYIQHLK